MPDHARSDDRAVQAQLDRFAQLSPGRDVLGLERITSLLAALGDPHLRLPPVLHVAGTNGKGSTCAYLRAILEAAGLRVHVYTSPHLVRFNERIRICGSLIRDDDLAPLLREVLDVAETRQIGPSFFEATTAAAFVAFARVPADACVIEVGLGGRLDATNVVKPIVCGIAQVGIDHQAFLGDTLAAIAEEKAGIAKPGVPLYCQQQQAEARDAIERTCAAAGAPLFLEGRDWAADGAIRPAMAGAYQRHNLALAAQMAQHCIVAAPAFGDASAEPRRLAATGAHALWPARLQALREGPLAQGRTLWTDGAHNPAAAAVLAEAIQERPMHVVLGILANKDADGIVAALAPHALSLGFVPVPDHASHDPAVLAARWGGTAYATVEGALAACPGDVLVAGSLYLCGHVLRANGTLPE